jgi:hypothetical protein
MPPRRPTVVVALVKKPRIPSPATANKATTWVPLFSALGSAIFGWGLRLIGARRAVQEPELVGPGDQVVLGVLPSFGVGPLVEGQAGSGFEEATLGAVAGDELSRLFPRLQIDEDRLVSSLLVDGHPHGGDGLALSRRDLHFGIGG